MYLFEGFNIENPGEGYAVGENLIFDNTGTGGQGADAEVSRIFGPQINKVESDKVTLTNCPIVHTRDGVIFQNLPFHDFQANDTVEVSGLSTFVKNLEGYKKIAVTDYRRLQLQPPILVLLLTSMSDLFLPMFLLATLLVLEQRLQDFLIPLARRIGPFIRLERPLSYYYNRVCRKCNHILSK